MNRKVVIGCAAVIAVIIVLTVATMAFAFRAVKKGKGWVESKLADLKRLEAVEQDWHPPSEKVEASWFPGSVDEWALVSSALIQGSPELALTRDGMKATFSKGNETMEVIVVPVSAAEADAVLGKVKDHLTKPRTFTRKIGDDGSLTITSSNSRRTTQFGHRVHVAVNGEHTRLWWMREWLFAFRPSESNDPEEFMEKFFQEMGKARPPSITEPLEKADPPTEP